MTIKSFLKLVEIQTKIASTFPFVLGILFVLYRYQTFKGINVLLFFVSLICIDMATTAINNYMDHRSAVVKEGYNYEKHNAIVAYGLTEKQVLGSIYTLLTIGIVMGVYLVFRTDVILLVFGILSFAVGIIYSCGPIPISRTPLGEMFSGFFMGGLIFFLTIYVQIFDNGLIIGNYKDGFLTISFMLGELFLIFLASIPLISGIANIMLANNICDMEEDLKNKRYTLAYYLGRKNSLLVFAALYYIGYIGVILAVIFSVLPFTCLLVLLSFPLVQKRINDFFKEQKKDKTFVIAVKNFMLFSMIYALSLILGIIIQLLF
jgi:1,4-dihydroxy-2-naphthoate octaprenyltransferase